MNRREILKYTIPTSMGLYLTNSPQKSLYTSVNAINETYVISSNTDVNSINFQFTNFRVQGTNINFKDLIINFYTIINDSNIGLIKKLDNFEDTNEINLDSHSVDLTESTNYTNSLLPDIRGEK